MEIVSERENKGRLGGLLSGLEGDVTNPGLSPLIRELIQSWYSDTLVYTPGYLGSAHP